jgi:hypothetical protein
MTAISRLLLLLVPLAGIAAGLNDAGRIRFKMGGHPIRMKQAGAGKVTDRGF